MDHNCLAVYRQYMLMDGATGWSQEVNRAKADLLADITNSPDYHCDTRRNDIPQPLLLTRGGEQHSYNVICLPGDELFAGDIIDAFGQKWIVMEARADATTHKTGIMYQCNKCFRFQNFNANIIERWGYVDISGYSSAFNSDTQLQNSAEQVAIYLPYDTETAKIYVDKRLPSHIGYDKFGELMLFSFKITGTNPVSESFNQGDHLLQLKAERFLFAQDHDNLELEVCDYIAPDEQSASPLPPAPAKLACAIMGSDTIRIGATRSYQSVFYTQMGDEMVDQLEAEWSVVGDGIQVSSGRILKIHVDDNADLIGESIVITLRDKQGRCQPATLTVEVTGIV